MNRNPEGHSDRLRHFIDKKKDQYRLFFEKCDTQFKFVCDLTLMNIVIDDINKSDRPDLIAYCLHKDILTTNQAIELLREEYNCINHESNTSLRRAVTYLGFKRMFD